MHSLRLALAGAAALLTQTTFAQTWQTVDDFQYVSNYQSQANALAIDANGNIYVAGQAATGVVGYGNGLVRRSSDQGATWTLIEDYSYHNYPNPQVHFTSIGFDKEQNIYSVGQVGLNARLVVRKSADGGASWATVLDVATPSSPQFPGTPGFAADASGAIYVTAGSGLGSGSGSVVFKSRDAGATWTSGNVNGLVRAILSAPGGLFTAETVPSWGRVEKSVNGGSSWAVVDNYTPPGFNSTFCFVPGRLTAMCMDAQANLYLGGDAFTTTTTGTGKNAVKTTTYEWVIRKGSNGGATWNTLALLPLGIAQCYTGALYGVGADPMGNLYAVGKVLDALNYPRWIVVKSTNQGASWAVVDDYGPLHSGFAQAIASDAAGNVYVCGGAWFPTGLQQHWVVRKQVGP